MAISEADIANMALSHLGTGTIETLTENSVEAQQANIWYDFARVQTLEDFDWTFARQRGSLSEHGDAALEDEWAYRYAFPADAVRLRKLVNPAGRDDDPVPFELNLSEDGKERTILTDLEDAVAVYTKDIQNTALFDHHYILALSYMLAHYMAFALTGNDTVAEKMYNLYVRTLRMAKASNANEEVAEPERDASWIRGRD